MTRFLPLLALFLAPAALAQSDAELQTLYTDFLDGRGVESFVDADGDVQFELDGRVHFIGTNADDPGFFNVVVFDVWPIESATERVAALEAVNVVSRDLKVVKGYVTNDNVWLACELYVETAADFAPVFERCASTLSTAVDRFADEM